MAIRPRYKYLIAVEYIKAATMLLPAITACICFLSRRSCSGGLLHLHLRRRLHLLHLLHLLRRLLHVRRRLEACGTSPRRGAEGERRRTLAGPRRHALPRRRHHAHAHALRSSAKHLGRGQVHGVALRHLLHVLLLLQELLLLRELRVESGVVVAEALAVLVACHTATRVNDDLSLTRSLTHSLTHVHYYSS
jgi:hypothetical protein